MRPFYQGVCIVNQQIGGLLRGKRKVTIVDTKAPSTTYFIGKGQCKRKEQGGGEG